MKPLSIISVLIFLILSLILFSFLYVIYYPTKNMVYNKVNSDCIDNLGASLTVRTVAEIEVCSNIALKISGIEYEPKNP